MTSLISTTIPDDAYTKIKSYVESHRDKSKSVGAFYRQAILEKIERDIK